ncbi:immunity 49 family protein [Streptomyces sp. NBC_00637]|uniref:immunity 49 family protein n=1 Tax=Streptomyces sp. NBC_00637 TaxID=2903667 RepID=UPI003244F790
MPINEVTPHAVTEQRLEQALDDMSGRAFSRWHDMVWTEMPLRRGLRELGEELADHLGARTVSDPALEMPDSRTALLTAAECAMGVLSLSCFPDGDFEIPLPLATETLSNQDLHYEERYEPTHPLTTARTWTDAFEWCVISGLIGHKGRFIGPTLLRDYAPAIRDGVPYSERESVSEPADLAEMDALCGYLDVLEDAYPYPAPLAKPDAAHRTRTAQQLDAAGTLTPDQRLLRVLLDDDQTAFEQALHDRLVAHRENVGADPAARTLLPVGAVTLAALAHTAHCWQLSVRSAYLPQALMSAPAQ